MKYQILFIPIWIIDCSHIAQNNSEVFVSYSGHSDLERLEKLEEHVPQKEEKVTEKEEKITKVSETVTEGVVFIPNEKPVFRVEDGMKIDDLVNTRRIGDLMENINVATEKPQQDILFISGKNNENLETLDASKKQNNHQDSGRLVPKSSKAKKPKPIDCTHLNCNNTINSVCGGKEEDKRWKFRLFLNECFFRKVNCGFQYAVNRYNIVPLEKCKNIGAHLVSRPFVFKPIPMPLQNKPSIQNETRRSFSSRRSLNMGIDGSFCAHACPSSCTDDYDPQCAVSNSGVRKVFLNHCKLDYNSCLYKVVWHRRPLSECVGGKKADMTQNRGFIGWMQRVGIVDRKGRLVLS
ncbi:unnamed protein product, partial [Brenthis ino]